MTTESTSPKKETTTKKGIFKAFLSFVISKAFVAQLVIAMFVTIIIIGGTILSLNLYTNHGHKMSAPDFTGLSIAEANSLAKDRSLQYTVIDSIYLADVPKGTVADQSPKPDFKIKKGRKLFLTMRTFNPEQVKMPKVSDVSFVQAKADLLSYGLYVSSIRYINQKYEDHVYAQTYNGKPIDPGTEIEKGTGIDLVLGTGNINRRTYIPVILGMNKLNAYNSATDALLNIGRIRYDETVKTVKDSAKARIYKQTPVPSDYLTIEPGAAISVWMTTSKSRIKIAKIAAEEERSRVPEVIITTDSTVVEE